MSTAREDDELIEAVRFPCRDGRAKATRSASSPAGTAISPSSPAPRSPTAQGARLAVGGVADRPTARDFGTLDGAALDDALQTFADRA